VLYQVIALPPLSRTPHPLLRLVVLSNQF
jgi:hypothetical protein